MTRTPRAAFCAVSLCCAACLAHGVEYGGLPRKDPLQPGRDEVYPGLTVLYDSIQNAEGARLRLIATYPNQTGTRFPAIFVIGWLSCDTVEARPGTADATQLLLQALAKTPGFATVRLEKAGVGDSEGDCARTDFNAELDAYRRAFRYLENYPFVDDDRIFLFGMSNGAGFAPLVAEGAAVRGYVVDGGWIKTWYEHMLEFERRRLALSGRSPAEMNGLMKSVELLYSAYLLDKRSPREILQTHPALRSLWQGSPDEQYGRPFQYYQQLQDLDLMAAWAKVAVPVLVLHGEFDWIMSAGDLQLLAGVVNGNSPRAAAEYFELPQTGHTFEHYASMQAAFEGRALPFDDAIARRVQHWLVAHH
jgi:pimeloyl-ACP methyl ester carboxylesterase